MASDLTTTDAADLIRRYEHFSELAAEQPVVVVEDGRPRNVLISVEEYERLRRRDQQAFMAADTPDRFFADIEELAAGGAR